MDQYGKWIESRAYGFNMIDWKFYLHVYIIAWINGTEINVLFSIKLKILYARITKNPSWLWFIWLDIHYIYSNWLLLPIFYSFSHYQHKLKKKQQRMTYILLTSNISYHRNRCELNIYFNFQNIILKCSYTQSDFKYIGRKFSWFPVAKIQIKPPFHCSIFWYFIKSLSISLWKQRR